MSIPLCDGVTLHVACKAEMGADAYLYQVENYKELHKDPAKQEKLSQWIEEHCFGGTGRFVQRHSLKKERVLALDEFSEMNSL